MSKPRCTVECAEDFRCVEAEKAALIMAAVRRAHSSDRDETAWLIERPDPQHPGCVLPNSFLGIRGTYDGLYGGREFFWAPSAHEAIRFARQRDAAMFIGAIAVLMDGLPHRETVAGLRSGELRAIPTEHIWSMGG